MTTTPTALSLLAILFSLPLAFSVPLHTVGKLSLTSSAGPESIAFDHLGHGPYTGVSDGRVLKWQGRALGWQEFATSPRRGSGCDGSNNSEMESQCGRPLGLQFRRATGVLYIADAYFGLMSVGPEGGLATSLATEADGRPFNLTNGVDVDQETGTVYFTDSSTRYERRDSLVAVITGDATGRLMKYDPGSNEVTVLVRGLAYPNGVALSEDNSFLAVAESTNCRILRYWLRGPRAGAFDVFAELPGYPDNVKRNARGEFWVAINHEKVKFDDASGDNGGEVTVGVRLGREGKVLEELRGNFSGSVSEVHERNGSLWLGSVEMPYVSILRI